MESSIERISPVECRVTVKLPWEQVGPRLNDKLRSVGRSARVRGFRPGKVPRAMLERMYGRTVREELARDLVQETFQTAVGQHETNPLTNPVVENSKLDEGTSFEYAARFEVAPEIEVKDYEGIEVRRRPSKVADGAVDTALEEKQKELVEIRPIEGDRAETQAGDIWTLDLDGTFGEQALTRKDLRVELGADGPEFIPGLSEQLMSLKLADVGSTKSFTWTPPQDNLKEEFKGHDCSVTVGLREVKEKFVPPLDDELARDTGEAETLDELKEKMRANLLEEDGHQAELEARKRLVESLLERNDFTPAPSMIAREVAAQVDLFRRQMAAQGISLQQIGTSQEQLAANMRPQATFNVKAFLLLDALGKMQEIVVSDEEVEEEVKKMAEEQGQNAGRLRAQMEKSQELLLLRAQMREERILDFLMGKSKVTEAPDPEPEDAGTDAESGDEEE
jgi:trigger factor